MEKKTCLKCLYNQPIKYVVRPILTVKCKDCGKEFKHKSQKRCNECLIKWRKR